MKIVNPILLLFFAGLALFSHVGNSSEIKGKWKGALQVGQQSVPIVFNVTEKNETLVATMDSPSQGAKNIPVESIELNGEEVNFNITVAGARYESKLIEDKLVGTWKQSGQSFPLNMQKGDLKVVKKN